MKTDKLLKRARDYVHKCAYGYYEGAARKAVFDAYQAGFKVGYKNGFRKAKKKHKSKPRENKL